MEKLTFALDIGSGTTKLVAGYVLDHQPIVVDALSALVPAQLVEGRLTDIDSSAAVIRKLVTQLEKNLNQKVTSLIVALPVHGLQIYSATKTTNIISQQGIIAPMDLKNLQNLFRKEGIDEAHVQIGLVPESFELEGDRSYEVPPLGEVSDSITMTADIHFLDKTVHGDYLELLRRAEVKVRQLAVDGQALSELLSTQENIPEEYVIVDIGANHTSLSFVAKRRLFAATHFDIGARQLTEAIQTQLGIPPEEALRLQEIFGYDARENYFDGIVYQSVNDPQGEAVVHQSDLNRIIAGFIETWHAETMRYLDLLKQEVAPSLAINSIPWAIMGAGRKLKGFLPLLQAQGPLPECFWPRLPILGARSPAYATALGLIAIADKYAAMHEEMPTPVANVERVKSNKGKNSYNAYEDEL
jgi:cell division ATPase FtsA